MNRRALLAELFGTFALVFCGTGAIVINEVQGGAITHVGIALTFGLIVLALIYALGDISGCHLNPAVTTGFWLAGRFPAAQVGPYLGSQCSGALLASVTLRLLFPTATTLGATLPAGPGWQSFVLELILTLLLMVVILCVSTGAKEKGIMAGVAVGHRRVGVLGRKTSTRWLMSGRAVMCWKSVRLAAWTTMHCATGSAMSTPTSSRKAHARRLPTRWQPRGG